MPYLAESVTSNEDATEWTVTLRPDLVFHDGNPLDAEAVKASMDRYRFDTLDRRRRQLRHRRDGGRRPQRRDHAEQADGCVPPGARRRVRRDRVDRRRRGVRRALRRPPDRRRPVPRGRVRARRPPHAGEGRRLLHGQPRLGRHDHLPADPRRRRPLGGAAGRRRRHHRPMANPVEIASFRGDDELPAPRGSHSAPPGVLFSVEHIPDVRVRQADRDGHRPEALDRAGVGRHRGAVESPFARGQLWYTETRATPSTTRRPPRR